MKCPECKTELIKENFKNKKSGIYCIIYKCSECSYMLKIPDGYFEKN